MGPWFAFWFWNIVPWFMLWIKGVGPYVVFWNKGFLKVFTKELGDANDFPSVGVVGICVIFSIVFVPNGRLVVIFEEEGILVVHEIVFWVVPWFCVAPFRIVETSNLEGILAPFLARAYKYLFGSSPKSSSTKHKILGSWVILSISSRVNCLLKLFKLRMLNGLYGSLCGLYLCGVVGEWFEFVSWCGLEKKYFVGSMCFLLLRDLVSTMWNLQAYRWWWGMIMQDYYEGIWG